MSQSTVAIVGSGIVGTTIAYLLTKKGYDVDVFEKGPDYPYPHTAQFREQVLYLHENPAYISPTDLKHLTLSGDYQRNLNGDFYMVVGGSATRWSGITLRMIPNDFKTKTLYGYGEDWPLAYGDLEPYYCKAESLLGVSGTDSDNPFAPPRSKPHPLPPFELSYDDVIFAEKLRAHGIVLHTTPQARTRKDYGDRVACENYGPCWVCPTGARYSPNYHLMHALKTGKCKLHTNVSVRRIVVDKSGKATGLVYQPNDKSQEQEHSAKIVIVAANAIESARLLLLSADERHPNGLGNNTGHVGKHLTFHHGWYGEMHYKETLYPSRFGGWTGQCHQFLDPPSRGKHGSVKIEFPFIHEPDPFLSAADLKWATSSDVIEHVKEVQHQQPIRLHSEASTGPEKYVTLSKDRDRFGDPFAHVQYSLNDFDYETYQFATKLFDQFAEATQADQKKWTEPKGFGSTAHHHGTCRMGITQRDSVVDSFGKMHDIPNLFVAGGSTFVGSAAVNPTLTMVALAIRTANYLMEQILAI